VRRLPGGLTAERLWPPLLAIAAAIGLAVLLIAVGRSVNRPPVIVSASLEPVAVPREGSARLRVVAQDPDGEALSFGYSADQGRVLPGTAGEAQFFPAPGARSRTGSRSPPRMAAGSRRRRSWR